MDRSWEAVLSQGCVVWNIAINRLSLVTYVETFFHTIHMIHNVSFIQFAFIIYITWSLNELSRIIYVMGELLNIFCKYYF